MTDPLAPPPDSRHPDTVFLLGLLLTAGIGQLLAGAESGSVEALVPYWMLVSWSVTITAAAAVVLAGAFWPGQHTTGLMVEAAGRVMLAPTALAYALAINDTGGPEAGKITGLLVGLSLASVWRIVSIMRRMCRLRTNMAALRARQEGRG